MKSLLFSIRVLWFLFLSNLLAAVATAAVVNGPRGFTAAVGLGVVSLRAGTALVQRSFDRAVRARLRPLPGTRDGREALGAERSPSP